MVMDDGLSKRLTLNKGRNVIRGAVINGPGLSDKDRVHLFDPSYSGREAGRGLGFGLCKCWNIVSGHGGRIEVDSVPDVATAFRVFLPDATVDRTDGSSESPLVIS